ncbi:hypothetical protein [Sinorhizobium sp. NFACC03]|uniref:hypothetical protein n=1 Tax=Sinorhizobium sp. NFACC03 TaxID=1566295 RepID=UPI00088D1DC5|nr:hypothetical protein [Sinorhizobium sp. NFACC03]SDA39494.1 hypothetical protein SAMN03159448_00193 [Sinorhizobium sp. NFACC03]
MARIRIGNDSTGAGALKIMKNNADDPYSTPDSERWKFLYNSKFDIQASLCDIWVVNTFQAGNSVTYYPPGSNAATFTYMSVTVAQGTLWGFRNSAFPTLRYNVPLFDVKAKKGGGSNVYNQQMVAWTDSGEYYHGQGGYYAVGNFAQLGWVENMVLNNSLGNFAYGIPVIVTPNDGIDAFNRFRSRDKRVIVWNLPGNNAAPDDAPILAPNGTKTIKITSTETKIAKPGYNVDTATPQQMAMDPSKMPVKVIAAADIALPAGVSYYNTGVPLPDTVVLDVHFYDSATIMYPSNPQVLDFGAEYWFDGTNIGFNATKAMRARFMLYLEDTSVPTGGSNKPLRKFTEGGVDVVQILRPGSADPPSWADIIVDTRRPQVQILAQGYFTFGAGNGVITDIPFDGTGMFPMVKYLTHHGAGNGASVGQNNLPMSWSAMWRLPFVKRLKYPYSGQAHAGESTYCELTANNARFYTFAGNVGDYYNRADSPGNWRTSGAYAPGGIRYFIFGIPQP